MEFREKTEFNGAFDYLGRINVLFYKADAASMNLDGWNWFHSLLAIYRELSNHMKDKELEEFEEIRTRIAPLINRSVRDPRKNGQIDQRLYDELHIFEIKLRRIYKDTGLMMKFNDDPSLALGN
jgi:hypothetical protein